MTDRPPATGQDPDRRRQVPPERRQPPPDPGGDGVAGEGAGDPTAAPPPPGNRAPGAAASDTPAPDTSAPGAPAGQTGPALARAVLDAARAGRRAPRRRTADGGTAAGEAPRRRAARGGWSGPGPDARDPQPFGSVLAKLVKTRGWSGPAAAGRLFGDWERVVGSEVADHCRPVRLHDKELTVEAVSTAWATQLRLLAGRLVKQIAAEVGHNVVTRVRVHGPAAPSWGRGPRRAPGPGPGDTYG